MDTEKLYIEKLKLKYEEYTLETRKKDLEKLNYLSSCSFLPITFVDAFTKINFGQGKHGDSVFEWKHKLLSKKLEVQFEILLLIYEQIKHRTDYEDSLMLDNDLIRITYNEINSNGLFYLGFGNWNHGNVYYRNSGFLMQISDSFEEFIFQLKTKK